MAKKTAKAPKKAAKCEKPVKTTYSAAPVEAPATRPILDLTAELAQRFGAALKHTATANDAISGVRRIERAVSANTALRDA